MRTRALGISMIVAAVCWTLAILLVVVTVVAFGGALASGLNAVFTPTPHDERDGVVATTAMLVAAFGAVAALLLTVVLDVVTAVMAMRRLDGEGTPRTVAVLALVAVGIVTVVPLLLGALAALAHVLDLPHLAAALSWLLAGCLLVLAPWARLGEFVGGIVELAHGHVEDSDVGPLP